jgi:hypothetical protein
VIPRHSLLRSSWCTEVKRGDGSGGVGLYELDKVTMVVSELEIDARWLEHCKILFNQASVFNSNIDKYLGSQRVCDVDLARPFEMRELLQ